jgi:protein ImuB
VLELIALARGALREMPLAPAPEGRLVEAADLEFAVDRIEPLVFVLGGLLSRLLARLEARHLACSALQLRLTLETGGRDARRVGLAAPTLDRRVLVRLLTQALESSPPAAAVESAALEAERSPLRADQLDLFRPAGPAPNALGRVVAGLQALCGEGRLGSPAVADDHRPERFEITSPGASLACKVRKTRAAHETPRLATRALRPPVAAQVQLRGSHPVQVRSALAHGAVVHAAGPWRTTGGWWSPETRWAYDHFDVLTSDGILSRLRFDHVRRAWHIDAIYD